VIVGAIKKIKSKAPPEVAGILIPLLPEAELVVVIASEIAVLYWSGVIVAGFIEVYKSIT